MKPSDLIEAEENGKLMDPTSFWEFGGEPVQPLVDAGGVDGTGGLDEPGSGLLTKIEGVGDSSDGDSLG